MNNNAWFKKENPLLSLQSMSGGAAGSLMQGAAEKIYLEDVFSIDAWEGNATARNIVNGVDISDKGGMVWFKSRTSALDHYWFNTISGINSNINSNTSNALITTTAPDSNYNNMVTSFNNDGYSLGTTNILNDSGNDFVGWTFAKSKGFFDMVTYTGDGTNSQAISHNLESVPGCIIAKKTSGSGNWTVYHRSFGTIYDATYGGSTPAYQARNWLNLRNELGSDTHVWGSAAPTDTQFSVGGSETNDSGESYIAYIFAHEEAIYGPNGDQSIISCGYYQGTGAAQSITLPFEPAYYIVKQAQNETDPNLGNWYITDTLRGWVHDGNDTNVDAALEANQSATEWTWDLGEPTATGWNMNTSSNRGDGTFHYIYIAIAAKNGKQSKVPSAGTDVFNIAASNGGAGASTSCVYISGFETDFALQRKVTTTFGTDLVSRLTGRDYTQTNTHLVGGDAATYNWDYSNGWCSDSSTDSNFISWMWQRYSGLDTVSYDGTGSALTVQHSLGQAPDMIWTKDLTNGGEWKIYNRDRGPTNILRLNNNLPEEASQTQYQSTDPTATEFYVTSSLSTSGAQFTSILFSSVTGISKVGTYTGNSNIAERTITTGFQPRFIIIKNATANGDWVMLDTTRGWSSGNDARIWLNETYAQTSTQSDSEPISTGFNLTTTNSNFNSDSQTYIYYAHA